MSTAKKTSSNNADHRNSDKVSFNIARRQYFVACATWALKRDASTLWGRAIQEEEIDLEGKEAKGWNDYGKLNANVQVLRHLRERKHNLHALISKRNQPIAQKPRKK